MCECVCLLCRRLVEMDADRHPHCPLHGVCSACCAMNNDTRGANVVKTIMFDSSSFLVRFELPSFKMLRRVSGVI